MCSVGLGLYFCRVFLGCISINPNKALNVLLRALFLSILDEILGCFVYSASGLSLRILRKAIYNYESSAAVS